MEQKTAAALVSYIILVVVQKGGELGSHSLQRSKGCKIAELAIIGIQEDVPHLAKDVTCNPPIMI